MQRYFIHLAYNGTAYKGWQIQPNGPSIQAELQKALSLLLKHEIAIVGCGRTDTGVHAENFYAHFDMLQLMQHEDLKTLCTKLNSFLPNDIAIFSIFAVSNEAHARFDAVSRTYQYHLALKKMPFSTEFAHRIFFEPDINLMNEGAKMLYRYEDFTAFSKLHAQTKTNNCQIFHARWDRLGDTFVFTIKANRFLRNMVRAITGTLLDLGRNKITLEDLHHIIESRNRCNAGVSMPAKALFLISVEYPYIKMDMEKGFIFQK